MTLAEKIVELLKRKPGLSDRNITDELFGIGKPQQPVNIACRELKKRGILIRRKISGKPIGNYLTGQEINVLPQQKEKDEGEFDDIFSEDMLKKVLEDWLVAQGWKVKIAWGRVHGIDIDATKENKRWIIEVKGQGSRDAMRVNYFLGILGETLQRMEDPNAKYSISLPDIKQFRNLWRRLPFLAKSRTGITAIFIDRNGNINETP
ncbi:MAG: hypothetical protein MHPDNHAH_01480 [Anaerolineales bacterium]|nr:hypothetical protein [Anaerolineales bacterium]